MFCNLLLIFEYKVKLIYLYILYTYIMEERVINKCECCHRTIIECTYTPSIKKAIYKYREKNPDVNRLNSKKYYYRHKEDEEWKAKRNEQCREANKRYYEKKKLLKKEVILL